MTQASNILTWSFIALTITVAAAYPFGLYWASKRVGSHPADARRQMLWLTAGVGLWLSATFAIARSGALAFGPMPPRVAVLILIAAGAAVWLSASRIGRTLAAGLPLAALVAVQGFRLPLEILMHRAYAEGVMPVQMSYSGWNFDIATGASALVIAVLLATKGLPMWVVRTWNWMGCALLLNIVVISWLSTPGPFRIFHNEPANVWITTAPFVWLPTVLVMTALAGHVLVFRRLAMETRTPSAQHHRGNTHPMMQDRTTARSASESSAG